ncbi:MAG: DUF2062 domain-containing protein [Burkholderiaceae bacterium]
MPRKFLRRWMPSADKVRSVRGLSMFGERVFHPALWHLSRRSAAGGVAIGLFCGLIPGPLQMLGAGLACLVFRVNLPIALVTTIYTNPLTIVPLYLIAYQMGAFVMGSSGHGKVAAPPEWNWSEMVASAEAVSHWMIGLGPALALGIFLLASLLALLGYLLVRGGWSIYLRRTWHARKRKRVER